VKVHYAALNPTDWKSAGNSPAGSVVGCDIAGEVVGIGKDVTSLKVGDRVCGFIWGCHTKDNGGFSEYCVSEASLLSKVPLNVDLKDASSLGIAWVTNTQGLHTSLGLPTPFKPLAKTEKPLSVLIWSASTSVGQIGIQFAKASGLTVIATASPKHFEHLKTLGADHVFDYNDPDVVQKIKAVYPDLRHAFDCISEGPTAKLAADSLGPNGGTVSLILFRDNSDIRKDVVVKNTLGYTVFGEEFKLGTFAFPAQPKHKQTCEEFAPLLTTLLDNKKIVPMPVKLFPRGLYGMLEAIEYMKSGKVSGEKLVVNVQETH